MVLYFLYLTLCPRETTCKFERYHSLWPAHSQAKYTNFHQRNGCLFISPLSGRNKKNLLFANITRLFTA